MQISITGRNVEITDSLRNHVEKRLNHVKKYFNSVLDADVVLGVEHYRHMAEVTIHANGITMHGEESTGDMYTSIDKVVDKIERQLRRYKSKILTTHRVSKDPLRPERYLQYRLDIIRGEDIDESAESPQVIKSRQFSVKPMSLDEAVMQMDLMNQEFLVYRDSRSDRVNVLYRRSDGNYGLIEPEM